MPNPFAKLARLYSRKYTASEIEKTPPPSEAVKAAMKVFRKVGQSEKADDVIHDLVSAQTGFTEDFTLNAPVSVYFRPGEKPETLPEKLLEEYFTLTSRFESNVARLFRKHFQTNVQTEDQREAIAEEILVDAEFYLGVEKLNRQERRKYLRRKWAREKRARSKLQT